MSKKPSSALAMMGTPETYDVSKLNLVAAQPDAPVMLESVLETFEENEGRPIAASDFVRITTPKSAAWEIPDGDESNGMRYEKTIEGVPVFWKMSRTFYVGEYGENPVPACYSVDGKTGIGTPGGDCATCQFAQFGADGEPPACRLRTEVYVLVPGVFLPIVIVFSPANNKSWADFRRDVFHKHYLPLHRCVVRFELTPEKSANKREYMRIVPKFLGAITPEYEENLVTFKRSLAGVLLKDNSANVLPEEAQDLAEAVADATARWFTTVRGTVLDDDDMRAYFLEQKTGMPSLADVVRTLTATQYRELLNEAKHFALVRDGMTIDQVIDANAPVSDDEAAEWLE